MFRLEFRYIIMFHTLAQLWISTTALFHAFFAWWFITELLARNISQYKILIIQSTALSPSVFDIVVSHTGHLHRVDKFSGYSWTVWIMRVRVLWFYITLPVVCVCACVHVWQSGRDGCASTGQIESAGGRSRKPPPRASCVTHCPKMAHFTQPDLRFYYKARPSSATVRLVLWCNAEVITAWEPKDFNLVSVTSEAVAQ